MLEVLTSIDEGGPSGTLRRAVRRAAIRRDRSAPPQERGGADDGRRGAAGGGTDHQLPARAGRGDDPGREHPEVVLEATYGWYWATDTLAECGAATHLAHPLGVKAFEYRRVKNDFRDAVDLADCCGWAACPVDQQGVDRPAGH